jgi:UDP-N-acetylglucosamine 2-epimerase (non-hydrolysing)
MAPTRQAKENLAREGILSNVFMVGNTIVDSVRWGVENFKVKHKFIEEIINATEKTILITAHRRENFGKPIKDICEAIKEICQIYPNYKFIWPVHPNPNVKSVVFGSLGNISNLSLIEPLSYSDLLLLINSCCLIISDSGGIQEEACILGKRIIVLRENTERMEVIREGVGVLVGSKKEKILKAFNNIIEKENFLLPMDTSCIYGSPGVSNNILQEIKSVFNKCR